VFVGLWLRMCLFVCGSVNTIIRNCVHRSSPDWVCRWRSLPSPTNPVWWRSMHAISNYRVNRSTNKQTHTQPQTHKHSISSWLNYGRPAPTGRAKIFGSALLTTASAQCLRLS